MIILSAPCVLYKCYKMPESGPVSEQSCMIEHSCCEDYQLAIECQNKAVRFINQQEIAGEKKD